MYDPQVAKAAREQAKAAEAVALAKQEAKDAASAAVAAIRSQAVADAAVAEVEFSTRPGPTAEEE